MNNYRARAALLISLAVFVVTAVINRFYKDIFAARMLYFMAESALVGGLADWFAVSALFVKPLGFPYHTELIPRNRDKLIDSVVVMVQQDLLNVESIKIKLSNVSLVDYIIQWVEKEGGNAYFINLLADLSKITVKQIKPGEVAEYTKRLLGDNKAFNLSNLIAKQLKDALASDDDEKLISQILEWLTRQAEQNSTRQALYDLIDQHFKAKRYAIIKFFNVVNVSEAADAAQEQLIAVLRDMGNTSHPLRKDIKLMLEKAVDKIEKNNEWLEIIESFTKEALSNIELQHMLEDVIESAIKKVIPLPHAPLSDQPPVFQWLVNELNKYWAILKQDTEKRQWIEEYIKRALFKIIESEYQIIGDIVRATLNTFSKEDLIKFIYDKAGDDLQWIRINGCIVGAVAGAVLFLFTNLFYDPIAMPVLRGFFNH